LKSNEAVKRHLSLRGTERAIETFVELKNKAPSHRGFFSARLKKYRSRKFTGLFDSIPFMF